MAMWDEIPLDIAQKIGEHIELYEDFVAFGGVCKCWRHVMKDARRSRASRQTPWLMLAEPPCTLKRRFYGLYKDTFFHSELPKLTEGDSTGSRVGMWSSKDDTRWIIPKTKTKYCPIDIVFFKGVLYSVADHGEVVAYERVDDHLNERMVTCLHWKMTCPGLAYIVESGGALFAILGLVETPEDESEDVISSDYYYKTVDFKVWEVKEVNNIRNKAVFVGFNSSFSIEASPPYCKPNCIYYSDDLSDHYFGFPHGGGSDMGVFDLSSGLITQDIGDVPFGTSLATPPLWVEVFP
ncbi:hypothetical protein RND81_05G217200 [Saponaria officinalis]|uniref:KIB1-4 beta-propeller domain-containing protein n=1 Tax=Saponaria officinalis TaxID=3572 RepID=A0AAW1L148_SAPOF